MKLTVPVSRRTLNGTRFLHRTGSRLIGIADAYAALQNYMDTPEKNLKSYNYEIYFTITLNITIF